MKQSKSGGSNDSIKLLANTSVELYITLRTVTQINCRRCGLSRRTTLYEHGDICSVRIVNHLSTCSVISICNSNWRFGDGTAGQACITVTVTVGAIFG